jgi:hypothetical protein
MRKLVTVILNLHHFQLPCQLHPTSALYAQALQAEFAVFHERECDGRAEFQLTGRADPVFHLLQSL